MIEITWAQFRRLPLAAKHNIIADALRLARAEAKEFGVKTSELLCSWIPYEEC